MAEVGGAQLASQATTPMKFPIKGEGALRKWPVHRPVHTAASYHLTTSLGPPEGIPGVQEPLCPSSKQPLSLKEVGALSYVNKERADLKEVHSAFLDLISRKPEEAKCQVPCCPKEAI